MDPLKAPGHNVLKDLRWLESYALRCGVVSKGADPSMRHVRELFSPGGWRVICRSSQSAFVPLLRNKNFSVKTLSCYAQNLASHGFKQAPHARVLAQLIRSSYIFFSSIPSVPMRREDVLFIRAATTAGERNPARLIQGHNYLLSVKTKSSATSWRTIMDLSCQTPPMDETAVVWRFACSVLVWDGMEVRPLTSPSMLWEEGRAMRSCLFGLRSLCDGLTPSRFFSVWLGLKRHATLELTQNRITASWAVRDCRLSCNRLPPAALVESLAEFAKCYDLMEKEALGICPESQKALKHKFDWRPSSELFDFPHEQAPAQAHPT